MSEEQGVLSVDPYMLVQLINCKVAENDVLDPYRDLIFADVHTDGWTQNEYVLEHLRWILEAPVEFILDWATDVDQTE